MLTTKTYNIVFIVNKSHYPYRNTIITTTNAGRISVKLIIYKLKGMA